MQWRGIWGKGTRKRVASQSRLTVNILTRNSETRLGRLLAEVSHFADEVLVGVDETSSDRTAEIAAAFADVVYHFRHDGELSAARMMLFQYASGDWILSLDDDESLEGNLQDLLPALMANERVTHYWFPRKWIVNDDPYEFLFAPPWYPDWQLRLFRNDRTLVWKPARPHSGYHVHGPGEFETGASILHFEPIWCSPEERERKLANYQQGGARGDWEAQYRPPDLVPRQPASGPCQLVPRERPGRRSAIVQRAPHCVPAQPQWQSSVLHVHMASTAECGQSLIAEVTVRNSGRLAWMPPSSSRSAALCLSYHLLDGSGALIERDGPRCATSRHVRPGDTVKFIHALDAPSTPGSYLLEWDMISEGEFWFADRGGTVLRTPLLVRPKRRSAGTQADIGSASVAGPVDRRWDVAAPFRRLAFKLARTMGRMIRKGN